MCSASASSIHIYDPKCPLPWFFGGLFVLSLAKIPLCFAYLTHWRGIFSIWCFLFHSTQNFSIIEMSSQGGEVSWDGSNIYIYISAGINKYCLLLVLLRWGFLGESLIYLFLIPHNSVWIIKLLFLLEIAAAVETGTLSTRPTCSEPFPYRLCLDFVHIASAMNSWLWDGFFSPFCAFPAS